ncbi:MAG: hypothetical protein O3B08_15655 [Proteobacteria bacterium]|nr:hypothetical protein [Pseudomonadota bacterium]
MGIVIGTLLLASGIILFSWSVLEFQRPRPPLWTKQENYSISFSVGITTLFSLGIAGFIHGITLEAHAMPGVLGWTVVAVTCAGLVVFMIGLNRWWKQVRTESPLAGFSADGPATGMAANDAGRVGKAKLQGSRPRAA